MSAQRYTAPTALERLSRGRCPECGEPADEHSPDKRFWVPRSCDLTPAGVADRVAQYAADHRPRVTLDDLPMGGCSRVAEHQRHLAAGDPLCENERPDLGLGHGCPWCGESGEDMKAAAGVVSFDAALEAHVEDCPAYQAEQSPSTSM